MVMGLLYGMGWGGGSGQPPVWGVGPPIWDRGPPVGKGGRDGGGSSTIPERQWERGMGGCSISSSPS